jgi:hypothetical protein
MLYVWKIRLIDLKNSYHQNKMKEGDERKSNFKTKCELFEWLVMLFSVTIAHINLMRLMNHILCAFTRSFVVDYFNDIYSKNLGEHIEHLQCLFDKLQKNRYVLIY